MPLLVEGDKCVGGGESLGDGESRGGACVKAAVAAVNTVAVANTTAKLAITGVTAIGAATTARTATIAGETATVTGTIRYGPHNPGPIGNDIASTFRSGSYTGEVLQSETTLYRAYGGESGPVGSYWSRTAPSGPMQAQMDSALNPAWGNAATNVSTIRVPAGTTIYDGVAASQSLSGGGTLLGGGSQVYIPKVNPDWLVP
jgi:hypothetical protein